MTTLGKRLKRLRKERKWTLAEVAHKLHLNSHSTYSNWEYDRTEPDLEMLSRLSDIFDVTIDYLSTGEVKEPNYTLLGKEIKFLRKLKGVSLNELATNTGLNVNMISDLENGFYNTNQHNYEEQIDVISKIVEELGATLNTAKFEIEFTEIDEYGRILPLSPLEAMESLIKESKGLYKVDDIKTVNDNILKVPILGYIAAGQPILAEEHIEEWTDIPNMWNLKDGEVFLLRVKGDSMIGSRIYDGDLVVVKSQQEVENGQIAVVNVNGEDATLKRVKRTETGQVILYPENPKYEPIFITNENARIIGKVIQVMFEPTKNF